MTPFQRTVPAGLIMMMVQSAIHTGLEIADNLSPAKLLEHINKIIHSNISKMGEDKYMSITLFSCLEDGNIIFSGLDIFREAKAFMDLKIMNFFDF